MRAWKPYSIKLMGHGPKALSDMTILHMLWLPFAYKFAPIWLGHHSLRGFLKQFEVDILGIPLPLSRALAEDTYRLHRTTTRVGKKGLFASMADYTQSLELTAIQVRALLYEKNRRDGFLASCHKQKEIMERFGVSVPPILVDQNNQVIG